MNIMVLGAASFIGTNLAIELSSSGGDNLTLVDINEKYFSHMKGLNLKNVFYKVSDFGMNTDFDSLLKGIDIVYHLISTNIPSNSNQLIADDLTNNVIVTSKLLDACIRTKIKKVIFISSGGTVYGLKSNCPLKEDMQTYPISSYGIQKIMIEKLLYLYNYLYGLNYKVIRLSNPYGPYQRVDGSLGVITTFTYKALKGEPISIFGDGTVIRDFIYIDDAIKAILNIARSNTILHTFNLGSGYGTSINDILKKIQENLNVNMNIEYKQGRKVDVPVNYLDVSKYEKLFGKASTHSLDEGISKTVDFIMKHEDFFK